MGDALPEGIELEVGEGYRFEASSTIGVGGNEGDCESIESGEEGGDDD